MPTDVRVNVSNWQQPQNVRWAFRHMHIMPSRLPGSELIPDPRMDLGSTNTCPLSVHRS